ncbi:hypothetical protein [Sporomusa termitida]|uniref:Uncharacterized protein n=1 Tax=Sporomusa termitida TaxID=2377 RepID=A0A517DXF2_9FIRM|nr:hypothetical protein [Sporomusa termitida]QDR82027.1 hypothetical protein SPTER_34480 [Sporomusa termitida]
MPENQEIKKLIEQLNNLGYVQYQLDSIIKEAIGTVHLNDLSAGQEKELAAVLQEYVDFAVKCRKSLK